MNDNEKARAEVARLEALQEPATKAELSTVSDRAREARRLAENLDRFFGMERVTNAGNGSGFKSHLIDDMRISFDKIEKRLEELEHHVETETDINTIRGTANEAYEVAVNGKIEERLAALEAEKNKPFTVDPDALRKFVKDLDEGKLAKVDVDFVDSEGDPVYVRGADGKIRAFKCKVGDMVPLKKGETAIRAPKPAAVPETMYSLAVQPIDSGHEVNCGAIYTDGTGEFQRFFLDQTWAGAFARDVGGRLIHNGGHTPWLVRWQDGGQS